ncbi:MAG TPA: GNAT family N-acetyltransferase [Rectinemataceae bacterium]|nr:GNAT family N-acetyltransferase [Rectinemataceae bacterium]
MLALRTLTVGDIPAVDPLLMAAYGNPKSFAPRLERLIALEAEGWILAEGADATTGEAFEGRPRPAGMGGLVVMGETAYIGLVATDPGLQGRGVATLVMRRLIEAAWSRGCARILLDASEAGRPLYEKLGFVVLDSVGLWERPGAQAREAHVRDTGISTLADMGIAIGCRAEELPPALTELDRECWGDRRGRVLASFVAEEPGRVFVSRRPDGAMRAYAIYQGAAGILGPLVAREVGAAEALIGRAVEAAGAAPLAAYLPGANLDGARLLEAAGFRPTRSLTHMGLGAPLDPRRRRLIYSQASFALG